MIQPMIQPMMKWSWAVAAVVCLRGAALDHDGSRGITGWILRSASGRAPGASALATFHRFPLVMLHGENLSPTRRPPAPLPSRSGQGMRQRAVQRPAPPPPRQSPDPVAPPLALLLPQV
jgi:hypothetical protein